METRLVSQSRSVTPSLCTGRGYEYFEASLIAEAKPGSVTAFDQLVHRYETKVSRVAQSHITIDQPLEPIGSGAGGSKARLPERSA